METRRQSLLSQANQAFRSKDYAKALIKYNDAIHESPWLTCVLQVNIYLAKARFRQNSYALHSANSLELRPKEGLVFKPKNNLEIANVTDLVPLLHVRAINNNDSWYASTNDSQFQVCCPPYGSNVKGFFRIEVKLSLDAIHSVSTIYIDKEGNRNESAKFMLGLSNNKKESRIIYLQDPVRKLRFSAISRPGSFTIQDFVITRVNEANAITEIKAKLRQSNIAYDPKSIDLAYLYRQYEKLYDFTDRPVSYLDWIETVEKIGMPTADDLAQIGHMKILPLFSVVIIIYNFGKQYLRECIESVLAQSYVNFELVVVVKDLSGFHYNEQLYQYKQADDRVKIVYLKKDEGSSSSINSAIEAAEGDYILILNHYDRIPDHALFFAAEAINLKPTAKILYSDQDKIDEHGVRTEPHFKSDWNPDLFYSQNYISNHAIYEAQVIKKAIDITDGVESLQNQDLTLLCLPHVRSHDIVHVSKILYHKRIVKCANRLPLSDKVDALEVRIKLLSEYFKVNGIDGVSVEKGLLANTFKVNWPIPSPEPLVSLLIPTRDQMQITKLAVDSILEKTTYENYEIIILDNGSVDKVTLEWFRILQNKYKNIRVLSYNFPFNYSAINNFGVKHAKGSIIGLINNDIEVISPNWLTEMVRHASRPDIGCVGAKLYYANSMIQHAGVILGVAGVANHGHKNFHRTHDGYFGALKLVQNFSAVTAACLLVRRDVYLQVKGLDELSFKVAYNDVDLCLKVAKLGLRTLWTPYAELYHHESVSRGSDVTSANISRFRNECEYFKFKWHKEIEHDPFYNSSLSRTHTDYSLGSNWSKKLSFKSKDIFYRWNDNGYGPRKKVACIFASYDSSSQLQDYLVFYLSELSQYVDIHFVSTAPLLHENIKAINILQLFCKSIIVRQNNGYDFGSWKYGFENLVNMDIYEEVIIANDSVYGPLFSFNDFFEFVRRSKSDVVGMTDSDEVAYHLQSYFIYFKKSVVESAVFKRFWAGIGMKSSKWEIITNYEIGLSQQLMRVGKFKLAAYANMDGFPKVNHMHVHWKELITEKNLPFLKIELVQKNPFNLDLSMLKSIIVEKTEFDHALIVNHR